MTIFEYMPHPWHKNRKLGPPKIADAREKVHGTNRFGRVNAWIGLKITMLVGTMMCAYLFTLLAMISAPSAFASGDKLIIVAWVAQTFIQLVLLPIIIVGQNVQAKAADLRSEATYADAELVLHEARQIQAHLLSQDQHLETILRSLPPG